MPAPSPIQTDLPSALAIALERDRLFNGVRSVVAAVSGGSDSMALLHLLAPWCRGHGIVLAVVHLNHGLRGAASDADADFVQSESERLGVTCHQRRAQLTPPRGSPEQAARRARLAVFADVVAAVGADAVLTGHTADDVAETLLLRLARGAGAAGLAGLQPRRALRFSRTGDRFSRLLLLRPLLACTRAELQAWLVARGLAWREDASNCDQTIPRNRVRHTVIPMLERLWTPDLRRQLARSAAILRADDDYLDTQARAAWATLAPPGPAGADPVTAQPAILHAARLAGLPLALQRRVVRLWLMAYGSMQATGFASVERVRALLEGRQQAGRITLTGGSRAQLQGDWLLLVPPVPAAPQTTPISVQLPVPGACTLAGVRITAAFGAGIVKGPGAVGGLPAACSLDPAAVAAGQLTVRTRQPGDRIAPLGFTGTRKLQDVFVDAGVPAKERDRIPLLFCGGDLAWIPGYRVSRRVAVLHPDAPAVQVRMDRLTVA